MFLPLTTRGQHLTKLHTPVTHHTPSCSPSSWTMYTPHSRYSAYWNCACMCFVTLCFSRWGHMHCVPFLCPSRLPAMFCFFYSNIFLQLDPDPVLPRCLLLPFRDRIPQTARIGPVGKLLNVRQGDRNIEDYAMDFEWIASPLWKRPSSCSSSGEAWLRPSDPRCLTGFQRSRWRTTSIWL